MVRFRFHDRTERHRAAAPVEGHVRERDLARREKAQPFGIPDFEDDAGPGHFKAPLPLLDGKPFTHASAYQANANSEA